MNDQGEKPSPACFKNPVFDWNVSLASRLAKEIKQKEKIWENEGIVQ